MDEPDWDEEIAGPPDWVFGAAREPDGGEDAALDERPGISEIRKLHRKAYDRWTPRSDADLAAAYLAGRPLNNSRRRSSGNRVRSGGAWRGSLSLR